MLEFLLYTTSGKQYYTQQKHGMHTDPQEVEGISVPRPIKKGNPRHVYTRC